MNHLPYPVCHVPCLVPIQRPSHEPRPALVGLYHIFYGKNIFLSCDYLTYHLLLSYYLLPWTLYSLSPTIASNIEERLVPSLILDVVLMLFTGRR